MGRPRGQGDRSFFLSALVNFLYHSLTFRTVITGCTTHGYDGCRVWTLTLQSKNSACGIRMYSKYCKCNKLYSYQVDIHCWQWIYSSVSHVLFLFFCLPVVYIFFFSVSFGTGKVAIKGPHSRWERFVLCFII